MLGSWYVTVSFCLSLTLRIPTSLISPGNNYSATCLPPLDVCLTPKKYPPSPPFFFFFQKQSARHYLLKIQAIVLNLSLALKSAAAISGQKKVWRAQSLSTFPNYPIFIQGLVPDTASTYRLVLSMYLDHHSCKGTCLFTLTQDTTKNIYPHYADVQHIPFVSFHMSIVDFHTYVFLRGGLFCPELI